jgi:hypothetical protein
MSRAMILRLTMAAVAALGVLTSAGIAAELPTSVFFRSPPIIEDTTGLDVCFRGLTKPQERSDYTFKYDLPVTLLITNGSIRKQNEISGKSQRLPGSQRAFRFNLKDWGKYKGPAFYRVEASPNGIDPCAMVELLNSAPAGFGKYFTITGNLRIRVASQGHSFGESRWAWKIKTFGASVIWQGTDNFINICINRALEIRSQGGRLYCVQSAAAFKSIRRLR